MRRGQEGAGIGGSGRTVAPCGVLLALLVGVNSIGAMRATFEELGPVFAGSGLWLLISEMFAALLLRLDREGMAPALKRSFEQWLPVAGATVMFILAGQVLAASGAAGRLARVAAGALGGALTGSNAGSNAFFCPSR